MCGRYTLSHSTEEILAHFAVASLALPIAPRYNIGPFQWVPIVISNRAPEGGRLIEAARWGFLPGWVRDSKKNPPMINARSESIAVKPFFRTSFAARRCIVPADGFYEWEGQAKNRKPWRIRLKDQNLMGFAGLYEDWSSTDGDEIRTCAIITTAANNKMSRFHDRMPVILPRQLESDWLNPQNKNLSQLESMLKPYPDDLIDIYRVSTDVNGTAADTRDLIKPIDIAAEEAAEVAAQAEEQAAAAAAKASKAEARATAKKQPLDNGQLSLFSDL